jgi:hypothetical protein
MFDLFLSSECWSCVQQQLVTQVASLLSQSFLVLLKDHGVKTFKMDCVKHSKNTLVVLTQQFGICQACVWQNRGKRVLLFALLSHSNSWKETQYTAALLESLLCSQ